MKVRPKPQNVPGQYALKLDVDETQRLIVLLDKLQDDRRLCNTLADEDYGFLLKLSNTLQQFGFIPFKEEDPYGTD